MFPKRAYRALRLIPSLASIPSMTGSMSALGLAITTPSRYPWDSSRADMRSEPGRAMPTR